MASRRCSLLLLCVLAVGVCANGVPRVVHGDEVSPEHKYPWVVAVAIDLGDGALVVFCGGALISSDRVLTAAHCIYHHDWASYGYANRYVIVGVHDLTSSTEGHQVLRWKKVFVHSDFDPTNSKNDIAIIQLESAFNNSNAHEIPMATETPEVYDKLHVAGWGRIATGEAQSDVLLETTIPVVDVDICNAKYSGTWTSVICAGFIGKGTCNRDSGGPAFVTTQASFGYALVGVLSFGSKDCTLGPSGFSDVASFTSWITEMMNAPSDWCGAPVVAFADGYCDAMWQTTECGFDSIDCTGMCAPGCQKGYSNDDACEDACNNAACNFDGGECTCHCVISLLTNGVCDIACNTSACLHDSGACVPACAAGCPITMRGNGACDAACNNTACQQDGGDCVTMCSGKCKWSQVGDDTCQSECNTAACSYDGGDCQECSPGCFTNTINDGICTAACVTPDCNWDGNDCQIDPPPTNYCALWCPNPWVGDGECDEACNVNDCLNDKGDCGGDGSPAAAAGAVPLLVVATVAFAALS
eukprot:TRINITY_DN2956_c0_g1_i4.p1 TRINITY_DN2956_c0_g1~~TRINITY_DN2956_c0_g1_i4.p1  ORF type:complete len:544 (+),score=86.31 TRINITY_DN2956_c0_g1_i4:46-1632(+)